MDAIEPMAAVVLVLALLGACLYLLKKRGGASLRLGNAQEMEVMERVTLGPQHALHLVRVGGRTVVVGTAPSSCRLICEAEGRDR